MILDLDIGNTRCKWRLTTAGGERSGGTGNDAAAGFAAAASAGPPLARVRVSNVGGKGVEREVRRLALAMGVEPEFACAQPVWGAVRNGYHDTTRLGVDRWLAICAAWARVGRSCLVVDAGSAITVDLLDDSACHGGGFIVPGLRSMAASLLKDTSGVRFAPGWEGVETSPGHNTDQAVKQGLMHMVTSFINHCALEVALPGDAAPPRIVLTGGDAKALAPFLDGEIDLVPTLVLDGLGLVIS